MKKLRIVLPLLLSCSCSAAKHQEVHGRSFLVTRPAYQHSSTQQSLWHNFIYDKKGNMHASAQVTGIYQKSRESEKVERYFLPGRENQLLVAGDDTNKKDCRNIRAEWLNLPSDFQGTLSISPEQRQVGAILEYNQDVKKFIDFALFENWWVSLILPVMQVKNKLNLSQHNVFNPGTTPRDIIEAFNQEQWCYDRIVDERKRTELAEVTLRLGSHFLAEEYNQIDYYSGISLPTSRKTNPKYLFDAVTGLGGHTGINAGINFQFLLNKDPQSVALCFFLHLDETWVMRSKHNRTFDLKGKPWSRFMLYNTQGCNAQANVPGVNLLTVRMRVRPWNRSDFSCGWRLIIEKNLELELGYNLWGHDEEQVKFLDYVPFPECFGIAGSELGKTASASTICNQAEDDEEFVIIRRNDIDLRSGRAGSALNHKVHGSIGYQHFGESFSGFFGAGWFIEIPQKNGALKTWGTWGKVGASF